MSKAKAKKPGRVGKTKPPRPPKTDARGLTALQSAFVMHYIVEKNASEAARKAGYSEKVVAQQGHENLRKPEIRAAIDEQFRQQNERLEIRADRILLELYRVATVDISAAFDAAGNLKPIGEIPEDVRRAIAGVEVFEEYQGVGKDREYLGDTKKVKFIDKNRALENLAKHFKLLTETHEHKIKIGLEDLVTGSHEPGTEKD